MVSAILLAAGDGKRLNSVVPKPLVKISGKPLIAYSLAALNSHPGIDEIILVVNLGNKEQIKRLVKGKFKKIKAIVLGGKRRQDSVKSGLSYLSPDTEIVLIHDSARPFVEEEFISKVIASARKTGASILGVPVKATIKSAKYGLIDKTLQRDRLWEIQTPQVFKKEIIINAYKRFSDTDVTDDASLVEKSGKKVTLVPGSYKNIKITTQEDLLLSGILKKGLKTHGK